MPSLSLARAALLALLLLGGLAPGCGPSTTPNSPEVFDQGSMEEVAAIYRGATSQRKKPPTSLKDFTAQRDVMTVGYNAIAQGDIIVYWGVAMLPPEPAGTTEEILAYTASTPAKGGVVLLKDGSIRTMTPDQFAAAPKPSGPTSAPAPAGKPA